ncbi:hypothetical protein ACIRU2_19145 [Streptomyces sp. NPDC101169]|uniref:hypothetical protein n=1 Tax=unclassified Streptomyces TaxID=2593676 RepID=UPI0038051186
MEQFGSLPRHVLEVTYARCVRCRFMGRVIMADEDSASVFDDARTHARGHHAAASMAGVEIVWDVIPAL